MNTPEVLYRGSPRRDADQFVPKETVGSVLVVSATQEKNVATQFIVPIEGLPVLLGSVGGAWYYLCGDEIAFRQRDAGGAIYSLPIDGFTYSQEAGVWINQNPVRPLHKEEFTSGLDAMLGAGIQVYFVSPEMFRTLKEAGIHRPEALQTLVSENTKRGRRK